MSICIKQHRDPVRLSGYCMKSPMVYVYPLGCLRADAEAQRDFGFCPLAFEEEIGIELV
jgi:hypothetical protein